MNAEQIVFEIPELRRYILSYYLEKKIPSTKKKNFKDKIKDKIKKCATSIKRQGECLCCSLSFTFWFFCIIRRYNIRFPIN